jgi:arginyl-tRNA synthetase
MIDAVIRSLQEEIRVRVKGLWEIDLEAIPVSVPPKVELGDLATPIAFEIAKKLEKNPRLVAGELATRLILPPGIESAKVEGGGYVNFRFRRGEFLRDFLSWEEPAAEAQPGKIVVEHTNINPNKAAHIGHLRNAILGDILVRVLRATGNVVEVQNYIDDTGVQLADVVVAFVKLEGKDRAGVEAIPDPFDRVCWETYARIGREYAADETKLEWRREALHAIEKGEEPWAGVGRVVADRIVRAHLATTGRIGVDYDLLPKESDVLGRQFWDSAFERLRDSGTIRLESEGKNAGCWVIGLADSEEFAGMEDADKILVRSNGTVTYTGKDIAYQLWKFGRLARDFAYRKLPYDVHLLDGRLEPREVWTTATRDGESDAPKFGGATRVFNVIDVRQSYLQKVVRESLRALGLEKEAAGSIHFSYEMVALTPSAAKELGLTLSPEEEKKAFVEMSGRKGLGVIADDLVDAMVRKAADEVRKRERSLGNDAVQATAAALTVGALRYFMSKFGRTKVIAFDFAEALNFEGDTGPYLQYAAVRALNIVRKLEERGLAAKPTDDEKKAFMKANVADDLWGMIRACASIPEAVRKAAETQELSLVTRTAHDLAQKFNQVYHRHPILKERNPEIRAVRLAAVLIFLREFRRLLETILGIPVPDRM